MSSTTYKARKVPNFDKLQRNFQSNLDKKKKQNRQTEAKPFNFNESKKVPRDYLDEPQNRPVMDAFKSALHKKIKNQKENVNPPSTSKMNAAIERRRKEIEEKRKAEADKKDQEAKMKKKQDRINREVSAAVALQDDTKEKKRQREEELKRGKERIIKDDRKNKQALKETIKKGRSRPLLIERNYSKKEALGRYKGIQEVANILKENGINPDSAFDDDQKDILKDSEYMKKRDAFED